MSLKYGDIITQIGEGEIDESHSFINALFQYEPGKTITIGFVRNVTSMTVDLTLGES